MRNLRQESRRLSDRLIAADQRARQQDRKIADLEAALREWDRALAKANAIAQVIDESLAKVTAERNLWRAKAREADELLRLPVSEYRALAVED